MKLNVVDEQLDRNSVELMIKPKTASSIMSCKATNHMK